MYSVRTGDMICPLYIVEVTGSDYIARIENGNDFPIVLSVSVEDNGTPVELTIRANSSVGIGADENGKALLKAISQCRCTAWRANAA